MSDISAKTKTNIRGPSVGFRGQVGQRAGGGGHMGFGPGSRGIQMAGEKPKDFKKTLRKFIEYIGKYSRYRSLVVMILAAASTGFAIAGPKIIGMATTRLFEGIMEVISGQAEV